MINAINTTGDGVGGGRRRRYTQTAQTRERRVFSTDSGARVGSPRVGQPGRMRGQWLGLIERPAMSASFGKSVIAHLGLSVRPRWLPDTRDDHDLSVGRPDPSQR